MKSIERPNRKPQSYQFDDTGIQNPDGRYVSYCIGYWNAFLYAEPNWKEEWQIEVDLRDGRLFLINCACQATVDRLLRQILLDPRVKQARQVSFEEE